MNDPLINPDSYYVTMNHKFLYDMLHSIGIIWSYLSLVAFAIMAMVAVWLAVNLFKIFKDNFAVWRTKKILNLDDHVLELEKMIISLEDVRSLMGLEEDSAEVLFYGDMRRLMMKLLPHEKLIYQRHPHFAKQWKKYKEIVLAGKPEGDAIESKDRDKA